MENNSGRGGGNDEDESKIKLIPDALKKVVAAGLSAAFLTEEGIRSYVADLKLPKDVVNKLIDGANKSKNELLDRVGNEIVGIIKKIDFVKEASRFAETHKFRVSAEIEVLKKEEK